MQDQMIGTSFTEKTVVIMIVGAQMRIKLERSEHCCAELRLRVRISQ